MRGVDIGGGLWEARRLNRKDRDMRREGPAPLLLILLAGLALMAMFGLGGLKTLQAKNDAIGVPATVQAPPVTQTPQPEGRDI